MNFAIATVQYWQQHGFDTAEWRKSINGTKAICHLEYAKECIPNIEIDSEVSIYQSPSDELTNLLNSSEWNAVENN